jgi:hypothetical protein
VKIHFKDQQHLDRFTNAIQSKVYDGDKIDPEYGAALYVLTANLSTWNKASNYIISHGILFEKLLKEVDFSGGYSVLIKWASNLFNGNIHVDPRELMRLDQNNFQIALTALQFRYYGAIHAIRLSDLEVL